MTTPHTAHDRHSTTTAKVPNTEEKVAHDEKKFQKLLFFTEKVINFGRIKVIDCSQGLYVRKVNSTKPNVFYLIVAFKPNLGQRTFMTLIFFHPPKPRMRCQPIAHTCKYATNNHSADTAPTYAPFHIPKQAISHRETARSNAQNSTLWNTKPLLSQPIGNQPVNRDAHYHRL